MQRLLAALLILASGATALAAEQETYDVVVYGGTAGGVAAAIQVRRMGKSVLLVEPGSHLGGLTSGGLGATDIGNKQAIGGISREFYRRVRQHYATPQAWRYERPDQYRSGRASEQGQEDAMWTFEPSVAEQLLRTMADEAKVKVLFRERLDLKRGVEKKDGQRIVAARMESGLVVRAHRWIDASYEGDLMALAGVSYHVGREANAVYQETLNGVQTRHAVKHQLQDGVDPYVRKGDPTSGLLPGVMAGPPEADGTGDKRVQAYNFRMCITDVEQNRIPFEKPQGYDPRRYELLFRNFEAGEKRIPWSLFMMPNRKTDVNNNFGFSTDNIGKSYDWAEGDYATRDRMFQDHLLYQRGLLWALANEPRVPEAIRREVSRWGNCKDEFAEHAGWSHQLYVREARRMVSDYVMTQHNCQGRVVADDPVGLAAYTMDSHHVQRYVDAQGFARNEGDVQIGGFPPYPIAYRSLVPKANQCENLLVPVCLAASHIAYGSIRMEPVFMVLGQSAATAACQSLDQHASVQKIDVPKLIDRLKADGQVLAWTAPPRPVGIDPKTLPGVVIDDENAMRTGDWTTSASVGHYVGAGYVHDGDDTKGKKSIRFSAQLKAGRYDVRMAYTPHANRATAVPVTIDDIRGSHVVKVDERREPKFDKLFHSLGVYEFSADKPAVVTITTTDTKGYVVVDAVQFVVQP